jgi:hypothetical protein
MRSRKFGTATHRIGQRHRHSTGGAASHPYNASAISLRLPASDGARTASVSSVRPARRSAKTDEIANSAPRILKINKRRCPRPLQIFLSTSLLLAVFACPSPLTFFPFLLSFHSGYCEGGLCCIESAVGAQYIGGKMRPPPGDAYGRMLPEVADEVSEVTDEAPNGA